MAETAGPPKSQLPRIVKPKLPARPAEGDLSDVVVVGPAVFGFAVVRAVGVEALEEEAVLGAGCEGDRVVGLALVVDDERGCHAWKSRARHVGAQLLEDGVRFGRAGERRHAACGYFDEFVPDEESGETVEEAAFVVECAGVEAPAALHLEAGVPAVAEVLASHEAEVRVGGRLLVGGHADGGVVGAFGLLVIEACGDDAVDLGFGS